MRLETNVKEHHQDSGRKGMTYNLQSLGMHRRMAIQCVFEQASSKRELLMNKALHIQSIPDNQHLNQDVGTEQPG